MGFGAEFLAKMKWCSLQSYVFYSPDTDADPDPEGGRGSQVWLAAANQIGRPGIFRL